MYIKLVRQLELKLVLAIDTHTHSDHITALGTIRTLLHYYRLTPPRK